MRGILAGYYQCYSLFVLISKSVKTGDNFVLKVLHKENHNLLRIGDKFNSEFRREFLGVRMDDLIDLLIQVLKTWDFGEMLSVVLF